MEITQTEFGNPVCIEGTYFLLTCPLSKHFGKQGSGFRLHGGNTLMAEKIDFSLFRRIGERIDPDAVEFSHALSGDGGKKRPGAIFFQKICHHVRRVDFNSAAAVAGKPFLTPEREAGEVAAGQLHFFAWIENSGGNGASLIGEISVAHHTEGLIVNMAVNDIRQGRTEPLR